MISKRLAALESKLARPADAAPYDPRPVRAQLNFLTAGAGHKGRNAIERLASALGLSVARLWRLTATSDRRKFRALYGALRPLRPDRADWSPECLAAEDARRAAEADDVADAVFREFLAAGFKWQMVSGELHAVVTWPGARSKARQAV
jgi:hypothetical protein